MNIKKLLILAPVAVLSLTSCGASVRYNNDAYQIDLTWEDPTSKHFNILHLTDLHISNTSDNPKHFEFIKETVNQARQKIKEANLDEDINLITITGDMFIFAGRSEANELFNFFDKEIQIPWAPTFGNHDEQVYFPVDWLTSRLNELNKKRATGDSYCVFTDLQDDDVFGNANYVINLRQNDKDKTLVEQLYFFDSNRYNFGEYRGYDYIHHDQIDWYERQIAEVEKLATKPKSLAFFHIPFPEFEEYYQKANDPTNDNYRFYKPGDAKWTSHDTGTGDPKVNTHLYDKMIEHGLTNGVFVGHNHTSNYVVEWRKDKDQLDPTMTLAFGVKSTNKVYCEADMLGGQIIKLKNDGTFELDRIFHEYEA